MLRVRIRNWRTTRSTSQPGQLITITARLTCTISISQPDPPIDQTNSQQSRPDQFAPSLDQAHLTTKSSRTKLGPNQHDDQVNLNQAWPGSTCRPNKYRYAAMGSPARPQSIRDRNLDRNRNGNCDSNFAIGSTARSD